MSGDHFEIEMCTTCSQFRAGKNRVSRVLEASYPEMEIVVNPQKPRHHAFNVYLVQSAGNSAPLLMPFVSLAHNFAEKLLWTGEDKGPPRRLKFPDPASLVVDAARAAIEEAKS